MYLDERYLLEMQKGKELSVTEAKISVISRCDFYAVLAIMAKKAMTWTFTRMSNLKAKVWLSMGDSNSHAKFLCRGLQEHKSFGKC